MLLTGGNIEKPVTGAHPVLGIEEFRTDEELQELLFDMPGMRMQALLITERVLGCLHKDTIFRYVILENISYMCAYHFDDISSSRSSNELQFFLEKFMAIFE